MTSSESYRMKRCFSVPNYHMSTKADEQAREDMLHKWPGDPAKVDVVARKKEFEDKIDKTLFGGDYDKITDIITPRGLGKCSVNCLEKSMEVSSKLYKLGKEKGPDAEELMKLGTSVEHFTFQLIDPLKGDETKRAIFGDKDFDRICDKAVRFKQKKFLSHPAVFKLLMKRWSGNYWRTRYNAGIVGNWKWMLLNMWTCFDLVLFPVVFTMVFLIQMIASLFEKRKDHRVIFLLNASWIYKDATFKKMKSVIHTITDELNAVNVKYAAVVHNGETYDFSDGKDLLKQLPTHVEMSRSSILPALDKATYLFRKKCKKAKKILVVMTDDKCDVEKAELVEAADWLKEINVKIVTVAVERNPDLKELDAMATFSKYIVLLQDIGDTRPVSQRIMKIIQGEHIFDHYFQYFTTPYFIFIRDTLSYLVLLGLHFFMCLQPSTYYFTIIEWIIMSFFLGRLMMEIYQVVIGCRSTNGDGHWMQDKHQKSAEKHKGNHNNDNRQQDEKSITKPGAQKHEKDQKGATKHKENVKEHVNQEDKNTTKLKKEIWHIMRNYCRDRWNLLDATTLVLYLVLLILKAITWSTHAVVSQNRLLAVAGYLYGLNAMLLTLRVFGHIMESTQGTGTIQIALFQVIGAMVVIFGQFFAALVAFSLAITKVYMVELSYSPAGNATTVSLCSKPGIFCWWRAAGHLGWSLLGVSDVELLKSSDVTSDTFARFLYAGFLVLGAVMLMNMMIALLSNIYQQVENNSFYEWSYKKAITIRTYSNYHPVPVPFNIISIPVIFVYFVYRTLRRLCQEKPINHQNDSNTKMFERLLKDLQSAYYSKYGYSFPLTEEDKMDLVMKETEGNHQIVGHLAKRVFRDDGEERKQSYPKGERAWESKGIRIDGNQLSYLGPDRCSECSDGSPNKHHGARYERPVSDDFPGFEVFIQQWRERKLIAVGFDSKNYDLHSFPGCSRFTVGYDIEQGIIFGRDAKIYGDGDVFIAHRGDLIGCFVEKSEKGTRDDEGDNDKVENVEVTFTVNGREIGKASVERKAYDSGEVHPYISLGAKDISVIVKMRPACDLFSHDPLSSEVHNISMRLDDLSGKLKEFEEKVTSMFQIAYDKDKRVRVVSQQNAENCAIM